MKAGPLIYSGVKNMEPGLCQFCKGEMKEGKTEFMARVQDQVIVITDVPAWVCERCGEAWFSLETSEKIDKVMKEVHAGKICVRPLAAGEIELPA